MNIAILIPAYNPSEEFVDYTERLACTDITLDFLLRKRPLAGIGSAAQVREAPVRPGLPFEPSAGFAHARSIEATVGAQQV